MCDLRELSQRGEHGFGAGEAALATRCAGPGDGSTRGRCDTRRRDPGVGREITTPTTRAARPRPSTPPSPRSPGTSRGTSISSHATTPTLSSGADTERGGLARFPYVSHLLQPCQSATCRAGSACGRQARGPGLSGSGRPGWLKHDAPVGATTAGRDAQLTRPPAGGDRHSLGPRHRRPARRAGSPSRASRSQPSCSAAAS